MAEGYKVLVGRLTREAAEMSSMRMEMVNWLLGLFTDNVPCPDVVFCDVHAYADWKRRSFMFRVCYDPDSRGWLYLDTARAAQQDWMASTREGCRDALDRFLA